MRLSAPLLNRRTRQRLFVAWAGLSLALWLVMAVAEIWTPLHAWMHGGSIPDNDDCAVVALAHGKVDTVTPVISAPVAIVWVEVTPRVEFFSLNTVTQELPSVRGPPVLPFVS